jgi:hypothetical protein
VEIPKQNRDPNALHPNFRDNFESWRSPANIWLAKTHGNANVLVVETFRTAERQDWLWLQGRKRGYGVFGRPVTWTKDSAHELGHAGDVVPQIRQPSGKWVARWDLLDELYKAVPPSKYGLETIPGELPHLQLAGMFKEGVVAFAKRNGLKFNRLVPSKWPK